MPSKSALRKSLACSDDQRDYLRMHNIAELIDAALYALLERRPADPRAFLGDFMHGERMCKDELLAATTAPRVTDESKRSVRVVATLGPASWTEEMLPKMIDAGVNIFRLNCSHRRGGQFEEVYPRIRAAAAASGRKVEVLGDLQGPKFRISELDGEVILKKGDVVTFALMTDEADHIRVVDGHVRITMAVTTEQSALLKGLTVGMELLIEDGRRKIKVTERVSGTEVKAEVLVGGRMKARQGVNVPELEIDCAALTAKDVADAEYLLTLDPPIEYIAVSFPQRGHDLQELIDIMDRLKVPAEKRPKICPKIEKPQALTNLDDIIAKSGALMVARGDLGVELGMERVPLAQKVMIQKARVAGLSPIIVATQMMESMIKNAVPTRAEVSDVENAVFDGADAVMLSGEAAVGAWPAETVRMMAGCVLQAQHNRQQAHGRVPVGNIPNMARTLDPVPPLEARRTLVVATLGPASWTEEMLPKMIDAGVNIFRLNCSHRRGGQFEEVYPRIRAAAKASGKKIEVLGDLQGPKFRLANVEGDVVCQKGDIVTFALMKDEADVVRVVDGHARITMAVTTEQTALLKGVTVGMELLIEDGKRRIKVTERVSDTEVKAEVLVGGKMKARQGVNVPDLEIDCAALTAKDVKDAEYLLTLEPPIEYIALSFPQRGKDIQELIDIMDRLKVPAERRPKICPKIEKPQAMTNLDEIIAKSGSLMVARGDLGVELGPERVPLAQKVMIQRAKEAGLAPVICATQMMESMIKNAIPTRAEVSDVENAVFDGADAVMLSGEAAVGNYPVETVTVMASCARTADMHKALLRQEL